MFGFHKIVFQRSCQNSLFTCSTVWELDFNFKSTHETLLLVSGLNLQCSGDWVKLRLLCVCGELTWSDVNIQRVNVVQQLQSG